ncbi:MAG: hypothetical protein J7497_09150, partial [Chitinophagaceae bacterium]|nr:hypothetical protein [Chitinophagaceae bacterium]
ASLLVLQPIILFQLVGKGAYWRSSALWNFNTESGAYNVPLGIGAGHAMKVNKIVFNMFLEPQFTFLHYGAGQPAFNYLLELIANFKLLINCQYKVF